MRQHGRLCRYPESAIAHASWIDLRPTALRRSTHRRHLHRPECRATGKHIHGQVPLRPNRRRGISSRERGPRGRGAARRSRGDPSLYRHFDAHGQASAVVRAVVVVSDATIIGAAAPVTMPGVGAHVMTHVCGDGQARVPNVRPRRFAEHAHEAIRSGSPTGTTRTIRPTPRPRLLKQLDLADVTALLVRRRACSPHSVTTSASAANITLTHSGPR